MKLFIEKENTLKIDENTELVLLNVNDFVSSIKRESSFVPAGHIKVSLKYKLINNDKEYFGESIFDSYKDISNTIDDNSPYKVELINWKLSDKDEKYLEFNIEKNSKQNIDNELIGKLREMYNEIFEDWELVKNNNQDYKDFFEETEKTAIKELYRAKDKATVFGVKLSAFLDNDNLTCHDEIIQLLINYFGYMSIYDRNFVIEEGLPCEKLSLDNVGLFKAVLVINVVAIIEHIREAGLPLIIDLTFEEKAFVEMLGPILKAYIPKIFDNITDVKFYYKKDSLANSN